MLGQDNGQAASLDPLRRLGIGDAPARCYLALVVEPGLTPARLAEAVDLTPTAVEQSLSTLAKLGLVVPARDRPAQMTPIPPAIAIEHLVRNREQQLRLVRHHAERLALRFRNREHRAKERIEVLAGTFAAQASWLIGTASREVLLFSEVPCAPLATLQDALVAALARRVDVRLVHTPRSLAFPGTLRSLRDPALAALRSRIVASTLPGAVLVLDGETVLRPLPADSGEAVTAIRCGPVTTVTVALFDETWRKAMPLLTAMTDAGSSDTSVDAIAAMLACGLEDEDIARELDISPRTVRRRIAELMEQLRARTRYQAGYRYAVAHE